MVEKGLKIVENRIKGLKSQENHENYWR